MQRPNHHKVLVIGAGISGIKAAAELHKQGIDCLVLEAKNVLGGRIYTDRSTDTPYDIGASWFHDCLDNPLFEKYQKELKNQAGSGFFFDDGPMAVITEKGYIDETFAKLKPVSEEIVAYIALTYSQNPEKPDVSLHAIIQEYLAAYGHLLTPVQRQYSPQLARFFELWFGASWDMLSAKECCEMAHAGRNAFVTNGFDTVFQNELKEFPVAQIRKNTVVHGITKTDFGVRVAARSNGEGVVFSCDYLIVTIPQAVLSLPSSQPNSVKWTPSLPHRIVSTFQKMSVASLGKIVLEFDSVFWDKSLDRFLCLSSPETISVKAPRLSMKGDPRTITVDTNPKPWSYPILFVNYHAVAGKPALLAIIAAPLTQHVETASAEKIWEIMQPMVAQLSKVADPPKPKRILTTKWTQDPYALATYSSAEPGDLPQDEAISLLNEGYGNIRFAGEYTIVYGNGCAHGAWMSGLREATWVIEDLRRKSKREGRL
ncbi:hypothetical protein BABINDRAFT_160727 [Babjeviella inositovora NRRL Y-12698]|uniref:Amine oxidase domain-containing protein n=1 Tax=Babjeviella inositovora NRRL Y-12698 TaxID=984486 RepID=A0A1E3QWC6_9ASCO|nr:uncharacterized protein BABINDRAFT_160727 [Babjeviella inositovora NRRL Y-12698]ODQ81382.1 hypothetical protein BABINDRAFT_160727 [Babjeviella inositovora NRRL Y-12698]